ncbi:white collar 1 protein [Moniliophthora roreri MCA 2997]|uniref:White collar 1 protein n=2 Tax=Moniliophthora roreri TaxID=221103 RepID=V2X811_MONRO|nr:white collar 1 protein [Moniliophthora roreri MCA 2997]KAI3603287.1 white collar 1 protein [Moniliophthora roreri]
MPFERYLRVDDHYQYGVFNEYDQTVESHPSNSNQPNCHTQNAHTLSTSADMNALRHMPGRIHVAPGHSVRLQIPQYMHGTPMLAPGGGAEVLPAGLFNAPEGSMTMGSWYANNGLGVGEYSPISIHPQQPYQNQDSQAQSQRQRSTVPVTSSFQSPPPFEYDMQPTPTSSSSATPKQSSSTGDPSTALSLSISSGLINPTQAILPSQLTAIGAPATAATTHSTGLNAPSPLGLPVYSASGFDLLSVMARVATRPDPKVVLGPVDLTSSFVVVDVRRYDNPVIYVSPTFCRLTGYPENEVLGRNCRFLQSPDGVQPKGEVRKYTSHEAVKHLKKNLVADKECQTSIINYKKNGDAFINLVTVIPIRGGELGSSGEEDKVVYHVGFQVDLTEQPNAILQKLKDGTYIVNYTANNPVSIPAGLPLRRSITGGTAVGAPGGLMGVGGMGLHVITSRDRKLHAIGHPAVSKDFRKMLEEPAFLANFPVTTAANADSGGTGVGTSGGESNGEENGHSDHHEAPSSPLVSPITVSPTSPLTLATQPPTTSTGQIIPTPASHTSSSNHPLSLILLEYTPDFIHVVSLKGSFLYVAPSVHRVLGYHASELVGRSLVDICHPADVVPLMRELKESSSSSATVERGGVTAGGGDEIEDSDGRDTTYLLPPGGAPPRPRTVDLLFRAQTKQGKYVWVECRGRLHVEPGKGRKAILLSGRAKEMGRLKWGVVKGVSGGVRPMEVRRIGPPDDEGTGVAAARDNDSGRRKRNLGNAEIDGDELDTPTSPTAPNATATEIEYQTEFWGTVTRTGILLVVTSGVKDVLGIEESELVGRHIDVLMADESSRRSVGEELVRVGPSITVTSTLVEGVRKTTCMLKKRNLSAENSSGGGGGSGEEGRVECEIIFYPASPDDSVLNSAQTISPANVLYQVREVRSSMQSSLHGSGILGSGAGSGSVPGLLPGIYGFGASMTDGPVVMHSLEDDVYQPLDTSRGSSWQYELQQLRFANERLKEEIRGLENELGKKMTSNPVASVSKVTSASVASSSPNSDYLHSPSGSTSDGSSASGLMLAPNNATASSLYPTQPHQSHQLYPAQASYSYPQSIPQAWPSSYLPPGHGHQHVPVSMSLPMSHFQSQTRSVPTMRYPHQPPSSLKRSWGDFEGSGPPPR